MGNVGQRGVARHCYCYFWSVSPRATLVSEDILTVLSAMDSLFRTEEVSQLRTEGISQDWPEGGRICLSCGCTGYTKGFHFQKHEAMISVWAFPVLVK